ncbi:chemotaxis protein CheW [Roseateles cavernae]|uniref:chemotaxis protein CheW n=1 Tax=Roseateles cavernae TaxID=3153578 RepID=UPI0032E46565
MNWPVGGATRGLLDWRGRSMALLELACLLGDPPDAEQAPWVLVLHDDEVRALALLVHAQGGLVQPPAAAAGCLPANQANGETSAGLLDAQWVLAPGSADARHVRRLDVDALFSARPESALACSADDQVSQSNRARQPRNTRPCMVVEADGLFAVALDEVHAVLSRFKHSLLRTHEARALRPPHGDP